MLKGYGVSPGIAIGKVVIKENFDYEITDETVKNVDAALEEFNSAVLKTKENTKKLYEKMVNKGSHSEAEIFKAHFMILEDPEFIGSIKNEILKTKKNPAFCINKVADHFIDMFQQMDDEYLKERALDIRDIKDQLMKSIFQYEELNVSNIKNQIIIAHELTPSDTGNLDLDNVSGFITETGGQTSHTAIMAKSLEIPAIVGCKDVISQVDNNNQIIMDGAEGRIIVNPNKKTISDYKNKRNENTQFKKSLFELIGKETVSRDGKKVEIAANIGTEKDLEGVLKYDAEGIGLFRTEFLYMNSDQFPTEAEQFEIYKNVAIKMKNKPVIIRTLDIGGDKELSYYKFPNEMNPFLGYRAIRMCLKEQGIFKTQLRAILRASNYGNLKIMFPMISNLTELKKAKEVLDEVKSDLNKEGISFDKGIEVGMMIEVPSAALLTDILSKYVDFFSIGTNDLIQYTVAVDRMNENLENLYSPYNPAVLRLINTVIKNAHNNGIWVGMCGEVAGNPKLIPILLGMGLDEFSMSSINILQSRLMINNIEYSKAKAYVPKILKAETVSEVKSILNQIELDFNLEKYYI
ncbi:MAG TPA: phosphoenolpyruvate--protein phosphotransferase [Clostridia bacterium]|nr:phosphoenolpyruvate--protein phosphotransferase [Clostridia bacterium]